MTTWDEMPIRVESPDDQTPKTPRAERAITEAGLPPLVGSESEVQEAAEIRIQILMAADDLLTELRGNQILTEEQKDTAITAPEQVSKEQVQVAQAAVNELRHQADASWWIAHRDDDPRELLTSFLHGERI